MKRYSALFLLVVVITVMSVGSAMADYVPLNVIWRILVGSQDRTSTNLYTERDAYSCEGQMFYLPASSLSGTTVLYRLFNGSNDHMDSDTAGEGGYSTEGGLGYAFTSSGEPGCLSNIVRPVNTSTGDHALRNWYYTDAISGYTDQGMSLWGYPRHGLTAEHFLELTAGGITVKSNKVAGSAVFEWWWNGKQFINDRDYGRQMQSSINWFVGETLYNPTEAGDRYSDYSIPAYKRHGSPITEEYNSGNDHITRCVPLEWSPGSFGGGTDNPVIWRGGSLGKTITLNFNGMGAVARYQTHLTTPITTGSSTCIEIPTVYLTNDFNRYYDYNAETQTLTEHSLSYNQSWTSYGINYGGVIISTSNQNYAMGIYGKNGNVGGWVSFWALYCFNDGGGSGKYDGGCAKMSGAWGAGNLTPGGYYWNTYIVTGTVSNCTTLMRNLYLAGY